MSSESALPPDVASAQGALAELALELESSICIN